MTRRFFLCGDITQQKKLKPISRFQLLTSTFLIN